MDLYKRAPSILFITAALAVGTAHAQQPPDVVQSDSSWNTTMGSDAMSSVTPGVCQFCGIENTAAGAFAMQSDTTGSGNVAMGFLAMQFTTSGGNNTAIGDSALQDNQVGHNNTAVGSGALGATGRAEGSQRGNAGGTPESSLHHPTPGRGALSGRSLGPRVSPRSSRPHP
jgi:hypothetical protein